MLIGAYYNINVHLMPSVSWPWDVLVSPTHHPQRYIPRRCCILALVHSSSIMMALVCCHINMGSILSGLQPWGAMTGHVSPSTLRYRYQPLLWFRLSDLAISGPVWPVCGGIGAHQQCKDICYMLPHQCGSLTKYYITLGCQCWPYTYTTFNTTLLAVSTGWVT